MKKSSNTQDQFIFSIYADDKNGLIGQIMVFFNRRGFEVSSLNAARTNIDDLVLITIEAMVPELELQPFTERLKKIVEVHSIDIPPNANGLKKMGFYRLSCEIIGPDFWSTMLKYGATLCSIKEDSLVIQKAGYDHDLAELYGHVETHLLSFCKSGLIIEESLKSLEELENL